MSKTLKAKKTIFLFLILLLFFIYPFSTVFANENIVNLYLFYGDGCPHCAKEREFLTQLKEDYGDQININEYEIYYDQDNSNLFNQIASEFGIEVGGVPFLVVADKYLVGYGSDETSGQNIKSAIDGCLGNGCPDPVSIILSDGDGDPMDELQSGNGDSAQTSDISKSDETSEDPINLSVPFLGEINLKTLSLPIATILIAFMDGFNPCAMWILIFLITMLINIEDKKKLYSLGSIFIITSALVYFVFLAAWFNFFKFIGYVYWIKVVIGIVAIVSGVLHVKSALSSKGGCHAVNKKKRKSIMDKIKSIVKERRYSLAILGIITLAISVNLIEVVCSAGLPSVYTNLLSTVDLSTTTYYAYLLLYIVVFMLDDLFVFFMAIKTFQVTGIASKYTKWSSLIGGIIIFIIGILLIFKPEVLMFG
jgi:thiol-disulfide isomerase/thioredoxin